MDSRDIRITISEWISREIIGILARIATIFYLAFFLISIQLLASFLLPMDYKILLEEILNTENYLCLATSTPLGQPWATPLCFVYEGNHHIFFISQNESLHALHIAANPHVAFALYNTRQPIGNAFWVQWTGFVKVMDENRVPKAVQEKLLSLVSIPILQKEYSYFLLEIDEVFLPNEARWKIGNDLRTQVSL